MHEHTKTSDFVEFFSGFTISCIMVRPGIKTVLQFLHMRLFICGSSLKTALLETKSEARDIIRANSAFPLIVWKFAS